MPDFLEIWHGLREFEVSEGVTKEQQEFRSAKPPKLRQIIGIVGNNWTYGEIMEPAMHAGDRFLQRGSRNIDRMVFNSQLALRERFNQNACLAGVSCSEFDEIEIVARLANDLCRVGLQNGALGSRGIVLRRARDFIEKARAFRVVEQLGGKPLGLGAQALPHVFRDRAGDGRQGLRCRHQPALCRKIATGFPAGKSFGTVREFETAERYTNLR